MRTVQLARIAAQAEKLLLQRIARRQAVRAGLAVVAGVFAMAALVALHVLIAIAIAKHLGPVTSSAIVLGGDLVIAIILGVLAMRSPPDPVEAEARRVRDRAIAQMKESVALTALLLPLGRMLGKRSLYGLPLATMAGRLLSRRRKR